MKDKSLIDKLPGFPDLKFPVCLLLFSLPPLAWISTCSFLLPFRLPVCSGWWRVGVSVCDERLVQHLSF